MYIAVCQCHEWRWAFHNFGFLIRGSHFALASSFAILRNGRSSYGKVFPVSTAEKLQRGSFFCSFLCSKSKSTKITGLLMFSARKIGKLRAEWAQRLWCSPRANSWGKVGRPGQPFPELLAYKVRPRSDGWSLSASLLVILTAKNDYCNPGSKSINIFQVLHSFANWFPNTRAFNMCLNI